MGRQVQRQANLTSGSRNDQETCVAIAESAKRKWDPRGSKGQTSWSPQTKVKSLIIMQSLLATVSRDYRMSCTLRSQDGIRYVGDFLRKHLWKEKERGVRTSRAFRMQGRSDPGQGQKEGRKVRWKSLKLQCTSRNIWQSWWGSHESKSPIVEVLLSQEWAFPYVLCLGKHGLRVNTDGFQSTLAGAISHWLGNLRWPSQRLLLWSRYERSWWLGFRK